MKTIMTFSLIAFCSGPLLAANISNPICKDFAQIDERFTPEYLAVIDGFNKTGNVGAHEVDVARLVTESARIKTACAKNQLAEIRAVRNDLKKIPPERSAESQNATTIDPTKAECVDFIALGEQYQPVATFWVAGLSKTGKIKTGKVDEGFLERPVNGLLEECKAAPTALFIDKAKTWLKKQI